MKAMRKLLWLMIVVISWTTTYAQTRTISGKVVDEKGEPLPGVSIRIKGTRMGVAADNDGCFRILAKTGDVLMVSGAGLETTEITIGISNTITIAVKRTNVIGSEVVVTALGVARRARMLGYATSSISSKRINDKEGFKTWQRNGALDENSVQLSVGDKDYLSLKSVQVAVQVDGFRARVLFDYFFYSNKPKPVRGTFKLKLPTGASPYYFAFGGTEYINKDKEAPGYPFVNYNNSTTIDLSKESIPVQRNTVWNQVKEAIVAPKEKAVYAFGEVVRGRSDPALMEWAGADVFSCSVFPLEKDKLHRIVIGYDINLLESGSDALFNLILPYSRIPKVLDIDVANSGQLAHRIEPSIADKNIAGNRIKYHLDDFAQKSFTISARATAPVFLQNSGLEKYFAVSFKPELTGIPATNTGSDAVFMLDLSLSSQPDKFNVWLKTLEGVLKNNRQFIKRFAVLCFNVDVFWWREFYSPNTEGTVAEFLTYADDLSLVGATDLGLALKEASSPKWQSKKPSAKRIFLLSDGDASWGEDNLYQLSSKVATSDKIIAFTTGLSGTDTRILDHLARQTNGAVFSILNEDEVDEVSKAIQYEPWRINKISMNNGNDLLIAGRPYYIFPGQKLVLTGRGEISTQSVVQLTVQQGTTEKTFSIPAQQIIVSGLTKRIYGQVAVNQLEDFSFKTENASAQYANYFDVAGQTCSWVMMESDAMYQRYGLTKKSTGGFVDSNFVTTLISDVLRSEEVSHSLGSAKSNMVEWIDKLAKDKLIHLDVDPVFKKYLGMLPESSFIVDVNPLKGHVYTNGRWFKATQAILNQPELDYDPFMKAIRAEKRFEGNAEAFKLISSFAENNRADITLLRDVAFILSEWNMDEKSYELSKRLIIARPTEPASYAHIAKSLVKMNRIDLALVYYEICFQAGWDQRFNGFDLISGVEYYRLLKEIKLGKFGASDTLFVNTRFNEVQGFLTRNGIDANEADLVIVITWNTDNTDVDLRVREPNEQECYYSNKKTQNGGFLSNDATDGFGPEMYMIKNAPLGQYHLDIDYYSDSRVETRARSKIMVTAYKNWGRPNEERFSKVVELGRPEQRKNRPSSEDDEDEQLLTDVLVMKF
jgi:hypothetical protein